LPSHSLKNDKAVALERERLWKSLETLTVTSQYQTRAVRRANYNPSPINADTVLAAAREHERYLRTVSPREYEMRVFDDGSVFFRNTARPTLRRLVSLAEIQEASRDFWTSPHRPLWRHILCIWE
jgi:hypothetical protein